MLEFFLALASDRVHVYRNCGEKWQLYRLDNSDYFPINDVAKDIPRLVMALADNFSLDPKYAPDDLYRKYPLVPDMSFVVLPGLDHYVNAKTRDAIERRCRAKYREIEPNKAALVLFKLLQSDSTVAKYGFNFGGFNCRSKDGKIVRFSDKYGPVFDLRAHTVANSELTDYIPCFIKG